MPRLRIGDPWRISWQILTSDYFLGAVLLAQAAALFLAAWLPQSAQDDLGLDVAWQAELQRRFAGVTWFDTVRTPLQAVGAFNVTDALGFRLLLALLALAVLTRLVDHVERVWQEWRAGDRPWAELGIASFYVGSLAILLGVAFTSAWGWATVPLPLPPGSSLPLGHGTQLTFGLESLAPDGRSGLGELWRGEDTLVNAGELSVGRPLEGDGVGVYLVGNGAGLRVEASSGEGRTVELVTGPDATAQETVVFAFTEDTPRHLVGVPEADLVLLLTMPDAEETDPRLQVQVFAAGSGEFLVERRSLEDTELTVKDVTFSMAPILYARIRAVNDPGAFWIQLGMLGFLGGALLWGASRLRRWWPRRAGSVDGPSVDIEPFDYSAEEDTVFSVGPPATEAPPVDKDGA